jgi:hypothetical protein
MARSRGRLPVRSHDGRAGFAQLTATAEDSLAGMHALVRNKMKLDDATGIRLSWMHDGESMVLEDGMPYALTCSTGCSRKRAEDDFPGFSIYARAVVSVVVNVELVGAAPRAISAREAAPEPQVEDDYPPLKKRKKARLPASDAFPAAAAAVVSVGFEATQVETAPTVSKKRSKKNLGSAPSGPTIAQVCVTSSLDMLEALILYRLTSPRLWSLLRSTRRLS